MKNYSVFYLFSIAILISLNCTGNEIEQGKPDPKPEQPKTTVQKVNVNFSKQIAESSYLLFGGCSPVPGHEAAWEQLAKAGVTFLRFDVKLGVYPEPKQITLEEYKANQGVAGSVADINSKHWNFSRLDAQIKLAKDNGLKTLVILNYCPKWLSHTGDFKSPPKDWDVWEDIIRQIVLKYKDQVDYWEIWNEPNGPEYLKTNGSPYPDTKDGMLQAYLDITKHTIKAAREADENVVLGGPTVATWDAQIFFENFCNVAPLQDIDFLSYHIYWHCPKPHAPDMGDMMAIARNAGAGQKPFFITEWNSHSGVFDLFNEFKNTPKAAGWIGKTFTLFLNQGVKGSNFFNMSEGKAMDDGLYGAYKMNNGEVQLFRFMKVFHLLSKVLDLGQPESVIRVYDSAVDGQIPEKNLPPLFVNSVYASACINSKEIPVIILSNPSDELRKISLSVKGLKDTGYKLNGFVAGPNHIGREITEKSLLFSKDQTILSGGFDTEVLVEPNTVIGIRIDPK